ncbi:MAG: hypothetical protein EP307_08775 [Rhodobacteraceae bacterium]|nr:MAG: hypothetical protein EP307_08775 [Paracoccaceae bacterium]
MRLILIATALGVLGACATEIPDSGAGVGFDNSLSAQRARDAALAGQRTASVLPPATAISGETLAPADPVRTAAAQALGAPVSATPAQAQPQQDVILEAAAALDAAAANSGVPPLEASPSNPPPLQLENPGISDENDFAAVSGRETIESDAQRIAQNRAQYQVITPTAVPTRTGDAQPNIVQFALETRHAKGTRVWQRVGLNLAARAQRNCAEFPSPDLAQIAFLEAGGPVRDRRGLDPDGDGFACAWDPTPFRSAVAN